MSQLEAIKDTVLDLPFHRACELTLLDARDRHSTVRFAVNDFTANPAGVLHGGILYALCDVACFFAVTPLLAEHQHPVTVETHTSMLRAAKIGEFVLVRATVDRLGKTLAAMRAEAWALNDQGEERLIATGSVTKSILAHRNH